jgi:L-threonylcarbamoyladenylate synthase
MNMNFKNRSKMVMFSSPLIEQAALILKEGRLVAFPTETVYGLGADARNPEALKKIFAAKERPVDHPLIVHLSHINQLSEWAIDISDSALLLAKAFWPGPLTLILKKAPEVSDIVTGGQDSIGVRIPNHPVALELLQAFNGGLAAPSANRFGRISPTTAAAVYEELGDNVDLILDGGPCAVGLESTIVDMRDDHPKILRPGMITEKQIAAVLQQAISTKKESVLRVSGNLESHYAPQTPTYLIASNEIQHFLQQKQGGSAVVAWSQFSTELSDVMITMPADAKQYAHEIYQVLRDLDKQKLQQIIIEMVPDKEEWAAIGDRLMRASRRG